MKPQHFAALAAAALASLVLAVVAYSAAAPWNASLGQGRLFPGLAADAKRVTRMEISQGSALLSLERKGEVWTLKNRDGYPANTEKVRALLTGLTSADLVEPKTRKAERYTELEIEDPAGSNANSNLLKLIDDSGSVVSQLIIGKKSKDAFGAAKSGTFVRKPGEDLSWLVNASLDASGKIQDWVKARIFETQADKIRKIKLEVPGEPPMDIAWDLASRRPKLADIPKGKRVKYANSIDDIAEALSSFDLEDVRKAGGAPAADAVSTATVDIDGGLKIVFKSRKGEDGDWLSLVATGEGEPKKFADDLTAAVKDWEFKLPRGKASEVFKKRAEILEDDTNDTEVAPAPGAEVKPEGNRKK